MKTESWQKLKLQFHKGCKDKGKMPSKASESNSKGKGKSKATGQSVVVADDSGQSKLKESDPSTKKGSSNLGIIQLLKTIQQSQTAQGERIDKLSGCVDDLYNYNYEQYDDDIYVDEYDEDVLLYNQSSNKFGNEEGSDVNNNEPPSKRQRTDTDNKSSDGDNVFTNAGKGFGHRVVSTCINLPGEIEISWLTALQVYTAGFYVYTGTRYVVIFHVIIRGKSFGLRICVRQDVYLEVVATDKNSRAVDSRFAVAYCGYYRRRGACDIGCKQIY